MAELLKVTHQNGIGETYEVEFGVRERCGMKDGAELIIGVRVAKRPMSDEVWALVINEAGEQVYATSPAGYGGRARAACYADGYREGLKARTAEVATALRTEWAQGRLSNHDTQQDAAAFIERTFGSAS